MARPLRLEFPDAIYHVTSRGIERRAIVADDRDRDRWLTHLERVVKQRRWRTFAFALMDNHFHLFVQTPEPNGLRQRKNEGSRSRPRVGERWRSPAKMLFSSPRSCVGMPCPGRSSVPSALEATDDRRGRGSVQDMASRRGTVGTRIDDHPPMRAR